MLEEYYGAKHFTDWMSDFLRILNYRPLFHACVDFIIVVHEHLFQAVRWKGEIRVIIFGGKPWNFEGTPLTVKSFFRMLANLQRWFLLSRSGSDKKITCHLFITLKIQLSHHISSYRYWIRINFTHELYLVVDLQHAELDLKLDPARSLFCLDLFEQLLRKHRHDAWES